MTYQLINLKYTYNGNHVTTEIASVQYVLKYVNILFLLMNAKLNKI